MRIQRSTMNPYEMKDVKASFQWLGHAPLYTELNAFHKDYQPGKENYEFNFKNKAFPKIEHAASAKQAESFVKKYHENHLLCYGLNPRNKIFRNPRNFLRSAKESEIEIVKNLLLDFDFIEKKYLDEKIVNLEIHFPQFDEYFLDRGLKEKPVRAFTGQGYHLLMPVNEINVQEHPDIKTRIKTFQENFKNEFNTVLQELGVKIDSTYDLSRKVKIYGTAKPSVGTLSHFFGEERKEDEGLRNYLLNMKLPEFSESALEEKLNGDLPKLFLHLLKTDSKLQDLWQGNGKNDGLDTSRSGYDYSIAAYLIHQAGYSNLDDLIFILSARPDGGVKGSGKGESYIRHTISNAIKNDR